MHSCVLHSGSVVVYCERVKGEGEEQLGEYGWQVSTRSLEHGEHERICKIYPKLFHVLSPSLSDSDGSIILGPPSALLTHCPPMNLRSFKEGVCLHPNKGPAPPNLLFFWLPGHRRVQVRLCYRLFPLLLQPNQLTCNFFIFPLAFHLEQPPSSAPSVSLLQ